MRFGRIDVSLEQLQGSLDLPAQTVVVAVLPQSETNIVDKTVSLLLTGPTMPAHMKGQSVARVAIKGSKT